MAYPRNLRGRGTQLIREEKFLGIKNVSLTTVLGPPSHGAPAASCFLVLVSRAEAAPFHVARPVFLLLLSSIPFFPLLPASPGESPFNTPSQPCAVVCMYPLPGWSATALR